MKICFLISDGVGIRNYLYSDILHQLNMSGHELVIWHSLDDDVLFQAKRFNQNLNFSEISFSFYKEAIRPRFLRDCIAYSRLKLNSIIKDNPTILDNWLPKKSFKGKVSNFLAKLYGSTLDDFNKINSVESKMRKFLRKSEAYSKYRIDLENIKPDILFCTHQREPNAGIAMLAASDLGIKTITSIFSWDNLPKGRLTMRSDYYLVWSEYMRNELLEYFPDIDHKQISIVGTPQFDFYKFFDLIKTKEEIGNEWGLDSTKSWICFSGDDFLTSPHDHLYLKDLAEALKNESKVQLIFRPVPVESFERYQKVLNQYSNIKVLPPIWKKGKSWNKFFPYPEDISMLVNLTKHCETVINVGSTMALDFAQFDHPAIYVNYEVEPNHPWSIHRVYKFQHFRTFEDLDAVIWINSKDEIKSKVFQALNFPDKVAKDRLEWKNRILDQMQNKSSSTRIVEFLKNI
jgi:hypothetical protein